MARGCRTGVIDLHANIPAEVVEAVDAVLAKRQTTFWEFLEALLRADPRVAARLEAQETLTPGEASQAGDKDIAT